MHYMKPSPFAMCSISFSINCNLPSVLDAPSTGGGKKKKKDMGLKYAGIIIQRSETLI